MHACIPANICLRRYWSGCANTRILACRSASSVADTANGSSRASAATGDRGGVDTTGSGDHDWEDDDGIIVGGSDAAMRETLAAASGLVDNIMGGEEDDAGSRDIPPRPEAANGLGVRGGCKVGT